MPLKTLLIAALETALNRYLALADNLTVLLAPLAGKVVAVNIQPFNESIYLCPADDDIQILDLYPGKPDTIISGSVWALGFMGISAKPMRSVFSGDIKIEGDIQTGKLFQDLFKKLDIDLEGLVSQFTGDVVANRIGQFFRAGQEWGKESLESFKLDTAEFLQEETRDLPAKPEADIYYQQVDELRDHVGRLNSRVGRLADLLIKQQKKGKP